MSKSKLAAASVIALTVFTFAGAVSASDSWKESYPGAGAGDSRESGCSTAENSARMNASAACMARMGHRVDDELGRCSCSSAMDGQVNACQVSLKVTCEKNGK